MEYGYIIKLSNKKVYKEIQLSVSCEMTRIGMDISCDTRLYKEDFFESFQLDLSKKNGIWQLVCSDNIYIDAGDVRKLISKSLNHGDTFAIKYQNSDQEVFKAEFLYDFDNENKNYDRVIDISGCNTVTIGSASNNNIVLNSQYVQNDSIALQNKGSNLVLLINQCNCGVYHNGKKAINKEVIKNGDFISVADFSFYFKDGKIMTEATNRIVTNITFYDVNRNKNYPKFNRNTRIKQTIDTQAITILDPPSISKKVKNNLLTKLLPSVVMIVAGIAMITVSPLMLISSGIGVITAIVSLIQDKKDFKNGSAERKEKYNKYIDGKKEEITEARRIEKETLESIYLSQKKEIHLLNEFSPSLFDRRLQDDDFLCVNFGYGDVQALKPITYKIQEKLEAEDELQEIPQKLSAEYRNIKEAPIVCDFKQINAMGIVGTIKDTLTILKNTVIDIISRQYHKDIELFFISTEVKIDILHKLRLLPQTTNEKTGFNNIVFDNESKTVILEYLYKELTFRNEQKEKIFSKRIVVFVIEDEHFKNHPISKFIDNAKDLGATFVFLSESKVNITMGCDYFVDVFSKERACLINTTNSLSIEFSFDTISDELFSNVIDIITPIYTEEISLEGSLTKNISLFKLLNILSVDDIDLEKNWKTSQVYKSMAAPLGVSKSGVIDLDLHDKAHGPHGLVAGTTGSGKSEILQTYILSMATLFHPYEVGFVIIDFKGGGMVNQFRDLPHLIGAITNIDGKEIDRSLKSIKAELQKRQRLFALAEVNHIDKYIRKFKAGEVETPIPHLILIVDEFAELKAEQPEFMKELISAARIGRSLGVHLILATQKPSGQVNEQIWSNSRFKLCLKVQDQSDSNEVIKSPLAAEIKEPGRAYLQVGNNEIFELFQSAYSGAPERNDTMSVKEFSINSVNEYGKRTQIFSQKNKKSDNNTTQLDAIVKYVHDFSVNNQIQKLQDICLPPLKNKISFSKNKLIDESISVGIYDDPDNQYQGDMFKNINLSNLLIIGASQTGKTNLLQLIIRIIATNKSPKEASFYLLDYGSMILKNLEPLHHIGGVITSSEEEKLKNLIKLLNNELNIRKEKLLSVGVSSFSSYLEAGYKDFSHIYVMLDNYPVFKELYSEKYEDELLYLIREGITYGLTFIMTSPSTSGLGYKYLSNFSEHIAFACNDAGEYSNLFDRCRMEPNNVPGRALTSQNKNIYEMQTFLAFDGEKEIDRVNSMRKFVEECNTKNSNIFAKRIPEVPDDLTLEYIENNYDINVNQELVVSLSYKTVEPISIGLSTMPQLAVISKKPEPAISFVQAILGNVKNYYFERVTEVYIIDSFKRDYKQYEKEGYVNLYTVDYSALDNIFDLLKKQLEERYEKVVENGIEYINQVSYLLIIVNSGDAIEYISKSKKLMETYNLFISKYKEMKFMFLFAGIEDINMGYSAPELYKKIKEKKTAFIFTDLQEHKVFDIPIPFIRQNKKALEQTQGYFLQESEIDKIRFVKEA